MAVAAKLAEGQPVRKGLLKRNLAHGFSPHDFADVEPFDSRGAASTFGPYDLLDDRIHLVTQVIERRPNSCVWRAPVAPLVES